eukprot:6771629-Prymnesium_polylepis.1
MRAGAPSAPRHDSRRAALSLLRPPAGHHFDVPKLWNVVNELYAVIKPETVLERFRQRVRVPRNRQHRCLLRVGAAHVARPTFAVSGVSRARFAPPR